MLFHCPPYTIGRYEESTQGSVSISGPALLASTLAWAAKNHIPFHQAVLSVSDTGLPRPFWNIYLIPPYYNWNKCLKEAHHDLVNGRPLARTLRCNLSFFLPEYYLQAVERAEKENRLPEMLPYFAKRLNLSAGLRQSAKIELWAPLRIFVLIILLIMGLFTFIVPKMCKIMTELTEGRSDIHVDAMRLAGHFIPEIFIYPLLLFLVWWIFRFIAPKLLDQTLNLITLLPPLRRQPRTAALLELSSAMACYLSVGETPLAAAKFALGGCRRYWLRRRLKRFIRDTENGVAFPDAWQKMRLDSSRDSFIIGNALARNDLVSGFDILTDWYYHLLMHQSSRQVFWLALAGMCINALLVFAIGWMFFGAMIVNLNNLSLW